MAVREIGLTQRAMVKREGHLARAFSRLLRKKIAVACMITIVIVYSGGVFAPWLAPYGYSDQDYTVIRQGPSIETGKGLTGLWSESHWAGTDRAGRDLFSRVLWGIQNTLIITVAAMVTGSLVIGITLGLISGYFGRWIDAVIMRAGEMFASFPDIFLVIILAATLKPRIVEWVRALEDSTPLHGLVRSGFIDYFVITLALVAFGWLGMARVVRGQVLFLKETQYVEAARAIGSSTPRILLRHILPNAISPIVVLVSMSMGALVMTEIILGFLGLGVQPPRPSLGVMLREAGHLSVLREEPWMLIAPGIAAWLLLVPWNLLGDALNDVLNPRTR